MHVRHKLSGVVSKVVYQSKSRIITFSGYTGEPQEFEEVQEELFPKIESDPNGVHAHEPGAKLDAGKVLASQILSQFPRALMGVAEVGTFGAKKYTLGGWQFVTDGFNRYEDAQMRHYLYRHAGEVLDSDSKLEHLKHEAWNALAKLELYLRDKETA